MEFWGWGEGFEVRVWCFVQGLGFQPHPPTPTTHPPTHVHPTPPPTQHPPLNFTTALKIFGEFFKKISKFTNPPS